MRRMKYMNDRMIAKCRCENCRHVIIIKPKDFSYGSNFSLTDLCGCLKTDTVCSKNGICKHYEKKPTVLSSLEQWLETKKEIETNRRKITNEFERHCDIDEEEEDEDDD